MNTNRDSRVFRYTFLTFWFTLVFFFGHFQAWTMTDVRWSAISFAALSAQIMLVNRMRQHDKLSDPIVIRQPEKKNERQPDHEVRYVPKIQSDNGQRIRIGKFNLTSAQWRSLASTFEKNEYHFVRDVVSQAGVFQSLTKRWQGVKLEFERLGWAEDGDLTEDGIEWFNQYLASDPPTLPGEVS